MKKTEIKVYSYIRVSTSMQAVEGYSLDAQRQNIQDFCNYKGYTIVKEYADEGISGKSIEGRRGFQQMLDDVMLKRDDVAWVISYSVSRLGRNSADILNSVQLLMDFNVNVITLKENLDTTSSMSRFMLAILAAVAEMDRETIITQTMTGHLQKVRSGLFGGGKVPYGYRLVNGKHGVLEVQQEEAEVVKIIFDKYANTMDGSHVIAKWLNTHGYVRNTDIYAMPTFTDRFVANILHNPIYGGKIRYGRTKTEKVSGARNQYHRIVSDNYQLFDGQHEAIVSSEIFEKVQKRLEKLKNTRTRVSTTHDYLLSTLIECPCCGKPVYGITIPPKRKANGEYYDKTYLYNCRNYQPRARSFCEHPFSVSTKSFDFEVVNIVRGIFETPTIQEAIRSKLDIGINTDGIKVELQTSEKHLVQLMRTQEALEKQIDTLDFDTKYYEKKLESLNRRLDKVFEDREIEEINIEKLHNKLRKLSENHITSDNLIKIFSNFDIMYSKLSDADKKTFMKSIIKKIVPLPGKNELGRRVKSIEFNFPVPVNRFSQEDTFYLPLAPTVESVCLLSKSNTLNGATSR